MDSPAFNYKHEALQILDQNTKYGTENRSLFCQGIGVTVAHAVHLKLNSRCEERRSIPIHAICQIANSLLNNTPQLSGLCQIPSLHSSLYTIVSLSDVTHVAFIIAKTMAVCWISRAIIPFSSNHGEEYIETKHVLVFSRTSVDAGDNVL